MKRVLFFLVLNVFFPVLLYAQQVDTIGIRTDSTRIDTVKRDTAGIVPDSLQGLAAVSAPAKPFPAIKNKFFE